MTTLSAVYAAPDANAEALLALCRKMVELKGAHTNYVALGDFNQNVKVSSTREYFKAQVGSHLSQIVKGTTKKTLRQLNNSLQTTETTIDLIFCSDGMKSKVIGKPVIHTDSPSDHFMVEATFDIKVPYKYVVKEYFLDTTRRRPIPKSKLAQANSDLQNLLRSHESDFEAHDNYKSFMLIESCVKQVLDKYAPLNKPGLHTKKIFRFTVPPDIRKLQCEVRRLKTNWRVSVRKKMSSDIKDTHREAYRVKRNLCNIKVRDCKRSQNASKLLNGIHNCSNVWGE